MTWRIYRVLSFYNRSTDDQCLLQYENKLNTHIYTYIRTSYNKQSEVYFMWNSPSQHNSSSDISDNLCNAYIVAIVWHNIISGILWVTLRLGGYSGLFMWGTTWHELAIGPYNLCNNHWTSCRPTSLSRIRDHQSQIRVYDVPSSNIGTWYSMFSIWCAWVNRNALRGLTRWALGNLGAIPKIQFSFLFHWLGS